MKKEKQVCPAELQGYRRPSESETGKILDLMQPELKKNRRQMRTLSSILACISVAASASIVLKLAEGSFQGRELVFLTAVTIVFWGCFIAANKSIVTNKTLEKNLQNGHFEVLDCIPYQQYYNQEEGRIDGSVKVQTKEGVPCKVNYIVDIETALKCEKGEGKNLQMLLMFDRETKESRVFTERMLGRR